MSATWYFYGTGDASPTIGDLLRLIREKGLPVIGQVARFEAGECIGFVSVDETAPLIGSQFGITIEGRDGDLNVEVQRPEEEYLEEYEEIDLEGKPESNKISVIAFLEPDDQPNDDFFGSLVDPVFTLLDRFFPRSVAWTNIDDSAWLPGTVSPNWPDC